MSSQSSAFRQVVLVQYPHEGVWVLGFVTGDPGDEVQSHTKEQVVGVMVPTTPNPTSGYLLYYPVQDVVYLKMSVEEAMRIIISMGIVGGKEREAGESAAGGKTVPGKAAAAPKTTPKKSPRSGARKRGVKVDPGSSPG